MASDTGACKNDSGDVISSEETSKNRVELEGLERFFEDNHQELDLQGLSIKQAALLFGVTRKCLKRKVMDGTVPAIRLPESHGSKWRVFPEGVPEHLQELIPEELRFSNKPAEENNLDFSVPGVDCPGQLILKTAGFLVNDTHESTHTMPGWTCACATEQPEINYLPPRLEQLSTMPALADAEPEIATAESEPDCAQQTSPEAIEPLPEQAPTQQETVGDVPIAATATEKKSLDAGLYAELLEKIYELEKQVANANYQNSYLEARLTGLEDQIAFLTHAHCRKQNYNEMVLLVPSIALLVAIFLLAQSFCHF